MPNSNEKKEETESSPMTATAILKAVGVSDELADAIVHDSPEQQENTEETELQQKIARIRKQKAEKLRETLRNQAESAENPASQTKKTYVRAVRVSKKAKTSPANVAVAVAEPEEKPELLAEPEPEKNVTRNFQHEPEQEPENPVTQESVPEKKKSKKKVKTKQPKIRTWIGTGIAVAVIASYFIVAFSYQEKFLPHTYINSLAVSGMTVEQAHDALLQEKKLQDLTLITAKGDTAVIPAKDFDAAYSIASGAFNDAVSENHFTWISKLFNNSEYAVKYNYSYSAEKLQNLIQNYPWGDEPSQNAKIVRSSSGDFEIQPETTGEKFDTAILTKYVIDQLNKGIFTVNMKDSGCYEPYRAKITTENLKEDLALYQHYANCEISFDFEDRKIQLNKDVIASWLYQNEDGSFVTTSGHGVPLNQEKIVEFVDDMAEQTDTYGKDREFYSTLDGLITVPWTSVSTYGWQIDREATVSQISELLEKGESATVEPVYSQTGYTRSQDDIGTTYIDVDISAQHFWYYKDNKVIMDYDVVSGTETDPGKRTPRGVCKIINHVNGITLGTYAVQGYQQWVDYWMAFNYVGCGFHDLSRGAYGGSIYMYNGSHGCLNMRWSEAKNLYENIEDGIPVIVHD